MPSVLINALLSSCSNPDLVLNALCWPSDTWPEIGVVEELAVLIDGVHSLHYKESDRHNIGANNGHTGCPREVAFQKKVEDVAWKHCVPLLFKISSEHESACKLRGKNKDLLNAVCMLLGVCVKICDEELSEKLTNVTLSVLELTEDEAGEESPEQKKINKDVAIEVLAVLTPIISSNEQLTATVLSSALMCIKAGSDSVASKILVRVLMTLLNTCCTDERRAVLLGRIRGDLSCWHENDSTPAVTARILLCLTALSDHLFHSSSGSPANVYIHHSQQFWKIVQAGLTHRDSVSRKRALYLLKRAVELSDEENVDFQSGNACREEQSLFTWVPKKCQLLREFWEDYALIMETLDENQIHVVRPVLNRMDTLIEATVSDIQGPALLHPSWLLSVYQRMFHSENKTVMREGVCHLLGLRVLRCPAFAVAFSQFTVGPFLDVLAESSLFHRSPGQSIGECPELGAKLQDFMVTFIGSLPQEKRNEVLLQLVQRLGSRHWCAVPILFLSQALSCLPPCPALGPPGLQALREVLHCTMITHQVLLRGAAQGFLLQSALYLTDVATVTLADVLGFLAHFRADESLCRGTKLWDQVCDWLLESEEHFKPDSHLKLGAEISRNSTLQGGSLRVFVCNQLDSFLRVPACADSTGGLPDPWEAELVARALFLCMDVEQRRPSGASPGGLEELLRPLLDTLSRLGTNVYLPLRKADKSLQLLLRLLQLRKTPGSSDPQAQKDEVSAAIEMLVLRVAEPIQEFMLRRLSGELRELWDVERASLYHSVLRELLLVYGRAGWHHTSHLGGFISALTRYCLRVLGEPEDQNPVLGVQVTRAVAMASLTLLCEVGEKHRASLHPEAVRSLSSVATLFYSSSSPVFLNHNLQKPAVAPDCLQGSMEEGPTLQGWGRVAAHFVRDQWACLRFVLGSLTLLGPQELPPASAFLGTAVEALSLLPNDLVVPVLDCMMLLLPQVAQTEECLCVEAVQLAWKVVLGLSNNPHDFWPTLEGFVQFAFGRRVLELAEGEAPKLTATIQQVAAELIALSQTKTGVFNVLLRHCCRTWLPSDPGCEISANAVFSSTFRHLDILTEACVYGPVFRRDQRLIQEVQTYVERLGDTCAANVIINNDSRDEQLPRMCALAFLSRLDTSHPAHAHLMETLVLRLLSKDDEISKSKTRYYGNSLQHRVKNRVWQTVMVLLPKLRVDFMETLLGRVYEAGFCSNQASVKYLIEWVIILTLHWHPALVDTLWRCFGVVDQEKTKTSICTFLSVLVHLDVLLANVPDKASRWHRALDVALQCCFSHNFSVRLYALIALKRVWGLEGMRATAGGEAQGAEGLGGVASVVPACLQQAEAMQSAGNAGKNWTKIQEHFFFGIFHPLVDYSMETIFHIFPSLSDLANDEWIPAWKIETLVEFPQNSAPSLQNSRQDLSQLQPGDWVQLDKGETEREERWVEVQKKITPWRAGIQEQDLDLQLASQQRAARLGKLHGALLVVASLIDKPTNLGGLCRTCEIFGASTLVLDSLRHVSDKHFQALSVSAELWLPLLEVKPAELADFLQLKKTEGYCIVGVEQTANSQSLQNYRFPEKTLLLLGNEREGIPANLLQLLDICVEIPQHGVTRSLNVHVSAALLVWEYTRQHLLSPSSRVPDHSL
ncbi:probable methyltransferase TARBP1 isoform X1 [Paramormyrops kingsleyae]|uniref:probable methyltransferase TARBP1 isoform X1 n=1 Tax=Paramormyrops kingsleyae TaxID=1676925 RepID=UPI003B97099F